MRVKYNNRIWFCLGVVVVELEDGTREGGHCEIINYTGTKVVAQCDHKKKQHEEITFVKTLTSQ